MGLDYYLAGQWDDAVVACNAAIERGQETGMRQGLVLTHALRSLNACHRGAVGTSAEELAVADAELAATGPQYGLCFRRVGLRRGRRGPRQRPKVGWESLTETERRVAELVAEGLSNPEIARRMFLSRNTVSTHVSHVLRKPASCLGPDWPPRPPGGVPDPGMAGHRPQSSSRCG